MTETKEVTAELIKSYAAMLCDLTHEQLAHGCRECAKHCIFFPAVAQIRQYAETMPAPAETQKRASANYDRMVDAYKAKHKSESRTQAYPEDPSSFLHRGMTSLERTTAMDAPGKSVQQQQAAQALQRLGGSTMPADPWASGWHESMALKNGWKQSREAGSDDES